MTKNLNRLLTKVYNCDTEAGHNLRYHIQRALACEDYKRELRFGSLGVARLHSLFIWKASQEGRLYWNNIAEMIGE